jgi:hypothetical protein
MQPQSPPPNQPYDFIFKEPGKTSKKLLPNLSGPLLVLIVAVIITILIVIVSVLFLGKSKTGTTDLVEVLGRAQEISRVNTLEQTQLKDPNALDLLATTQIALSSEQSELNSYAKTNKIKVDSKKLAIYKNLQTDSQLQTAAQNNNLDSAYSSYLKQALQSYSDALAKAYQNTKKTDLKTILHNDYVSTQTLLGNPPKSP